jgi:formylglycine-generating enzyme required for sulfatase activity
VTRHEYAQFVNATRRPASECMSHKLLAVLAGRRNWTEPGFEQTGDQPVVCVSWNDANAYVQWLNSRGGQRYRLPTLADWHEAGAAATADPASIESSYSNWLQDCASGCQRRLVAGRSWRERKPSSPAQRPGDFGHDDVGFRVVREIGGRN